MGHGFHSYVIFSSYKLVISPLTIDISPINHIFPTVKTGDQREGRTAEEGAEAPLCTVFVFPGMMRKSRRVTR